MRASEVSGEGGAQVNRLLTIPEMLAVVLAIILIGGAALLLIPNPGAY